MSSVIESSVEELVLGFQSALSALIPHLLKLEIVDKNLKGYDGWDSIADALFSAIIEDSIRNSIPFAEAESFKMAKYGFEYTDLKGLSYIGCSSRDDIANQSYLFLDLKTSEKYSPEPVIARVQVLGSDESLGKIKDINFSEMSFWCSYAIGDTRTVITKINIEN